MKRKHTATGIGELAFKEDRHLLATKILPNKLYEDQFKKDVAVKGLIAEDIRVKLLQIEKQFLGQVIQTCHGDIAYHFTLNNQKEEFQEGEVIGFFGQDSKQTVEKLTSANCKDVKLQGVVTRSQYFEGMKPRNADTSTETICLMGVVPVKVIGKVQPRDALYSCPDHPGVAISQSELSNDDTEKSKYAFVGMAFEGKPLNDTKTICFVMTIISMNQSITQRMFNERLESMNAQYHQRIEHVKKSGKNFRKRCLCISILVTLILLLVSIFMWQYFFPGSKFRYWKCSLGRAEPTGDVSFRFVSFKDLSKYVSVHGIRFEYFELLDKMDLQHYEPLNLNDTSTRYYLNIDRCAHGGIRRTPDTSRGLKVVAGPNIFAVDGGCRYVYFFNDNLGKWRKYLTADVLKCNHGD
eukprot:TCONS_00067868-protein